tara:strand:+ start:4599 stop:4721 length:123 start_codon:yes stop_codon:yes gene_type:complete
MEDKLLGFLLMIFTTHGMLAFLLYHTMKKQDKKNKIKMNN